MSSHDLRTGGMGSMTFAVLFVLALIPGQLHSQQATVSYQGRLSDHGAPANGSYDLTFTIYDSSSDGGTLTGTITNRDLAVKDGLFSVNLEFGGAVFNGQPRWLEIAARTNGAADFVLMTPRQPLTTVPSAFYASTAGAAATLTGAIPNASLSGTYGGAVSFTNPASSFAGSGVGLTDVPGTVIARVVDGNAIQAQANSAYILTSAEPVSVTLPPAPKIGDMIRLAGAGPGGWTLAQNTGQSVLGNNLVNSLTPWSVLPGAAVAQGETVASSADGVHLIVGNAGYLQISSDDGVTWSTPPIQPAGNRFHFAISSDGQHLAGAAPGRYIYTSADFGSNWIAQTNSMITNYSSIAASADGSRVTAAADGGGIYASSDFGMHWVRSSAPSNAWVSVTSSADGSHLAAAAFLGGIYLSSDFGTNWHVIALAAAGTWQAMASSSDGSRLVALEDSTNAWLSTDAGEHWRPSPLGGSFFYSVTCSADGLRIFAVTGGRILASADGGLSWFQSNAPANSWRSVASSATGNVIATGPGTGVYAFKTSTSTGSSGYLSGGPYAAIELQYVGNGHFIPLSHEGTLLTY